MNEPLLRIDHLTIAFGEAKVVHGISFDIYRGHTVALVGESGSGKSITASAIMGLLPANAKVTIGTVRHLPSQTNWIAPQHPSKAPLGQGLSMVFQDPMSSLNPSMRVGWQVAESLIVHQGLTKKQARTDATDLLEEVELPDPATLFERYPHELSGGQKQRVMIALALAAKPELLIADEPTTALDVTVQRAVLNLLNRLKKRRKLALLFITHDLDVVRDIADDVLVMQNGELVEQGSVDNVMKQPKHPYTQALINARTIQPRAIQTPIGNILVSAKNVTKSYSLKENFWGKTIHALHAVNDVSLTIVA